MASAKELIRRRTRGTARHGARAPQAPLVLATERIKYRCTLRPLRRGISIRLSANPARGAGACQLCPRFVPKLTESDACRRLPGVSRRRDWGCARPARTAAARHGARPADGSISAPNLRG